MIEAEKISLAMIFPVGVVTATKNGYEKNGLSEAFLRPLEPSLPSNNSFKSIIAVLEESLHVLSALLRSTREIRFFLSCLRGLEKSLIELRSSTISTCGQGLRRSFSGVFPVAPAAYILPPATS